MVWPFRPNRRPLRQARKVNVSERPGGEYASHYCECTGSRTRDHKIPRVFGGTDIAENIVWCCQMCNIIKGTRPLRCSWSCFANSWRPTGKRIAQPTLDDWECIGAMARKFNTWLHGLQHRESVEAEEGELQGRDEGGCEDSRKSKEKLTNYGGREHRGFCRTEARETSSRARIRRRQAAAGTHFHKATDTCGRILIVAIAASPRGISRGAHAPASRPRTLRMASSNLRPS
jgi:hypothetical protein